MTRGDALYVGGWIVAGAVWWVLMLHVVLPWAERRTDRLLTRERLARAQRIAERTRAREAARESRRLTPAQRDAVLQRAQQERDTPRRSER